MDTSVWIDFFRGIPTKETDRLADLIERDQDLCTCGIILTEILQGMKSDRDYLRVKKLLDGLIYLPIHRKTFLRAAGIYRATRSHGVTIRKTIDCIIAACALDHNVSLLHKDADFDRIAEFSGLKVTRD